MAVHKELCVVVRKYKNQQGEDKNEYLNIGRIIKKDDGSTFMVLKPHVNLAAIPRQGDDVMVAMFDPKDNSGSSNQGSQNRANQGQSKQSQNEPNEDIPF